MMGMRHCAGRLYTVKVLLMGEAVRLEINRRGASSK